MNFSTVPAMRSTIPRIPRNTGHSARNASGSVDSPSAVEPTRSQNSTVTVFRTSRDAAGDASAAPQLLRTGRPAVVPARSSRK